MAALVIPPTYNDLHSIYSSNPVEFQKSKERFDKIAKLFETTFGAPFDFAVRAPGRVNLIGSFYPPYELFASIYSLEGEHVDYSGYGVLPMAIEQDTLILIRRIHEKSENSPTLYLHNANGAKFTSRVIEKATHELEINSKVHEWSNYFLAGYKGVLEYAKAQSIVPVSFQAMVDGNVPIGSGLSSSSALVCASALATVVANNIQGLSKTELATLCMKSERYVGVEGGGMDQAISYLAAKGQAELIEFDPLTTQDVHLPQGAIFVISNSLVESNKYVTANTCYNMRVVECRLASALLAKYLQIPNWRAVRRLIQVQQLTNLGFPELLHSVQKFLHKEPYTIDEISKILELDIDTITKDYLALINKDSKFECYSRAYHVYAESLRVYQFRDTCHKSAYSDQLADLGKLMNDSHESCGKLFDCSCPELDILTGICRESGALGSRLTGAGWGGCTISLVPAEKIANFIASVKKKYYLETLKKAESEITDAVLFITQPGSGAGIYIPQ